MLRPATPLAVLLLAAFGLLLISVLSTPIIKVIPLGTFHGVNFGVFGFCKPDGCSSFEIGYDTSSIFSADDSATFDLPSSTRTTLSAILVMHPVAAFLTLVMFIFAIVAHFHSPSHSSRYLLVVFIVSLLTFLVCLLCFLVDVLLFVPHLAWGSYLVLAAAILTLLSSLVSCAMRRTIVSRKARRKRIAENAEMSGENYYNREAQVKPAPVVASALEPTVPVVSGANGPGDQLPEFASFEKKENDRTSDERIPLTARSPDRSPNNLAATDMASAPTAMDGVPYNGYAGPNPPRRSPSNGPPQRDQYGNIIPGGAPDGYGMRRGPSFESANSANSRGRGGMPPGGYRGRGGYGPARGGYNGYGPPPGPNGRGGYGAPGRGGYGPPQGGRGGYGPPPRGYGPGMRGGRGPPPGYQGAYDRRGSPAGAPYQGQGQGQGQYGRQLSSGPAAGPGYMTNASMPSVSTSSDSYGAQRESLARAESPPPMPEIDGTARPGQAIEMDAATSSPAHAPQGFGQFGIRESDSDVAGMLALQQGKPPRQDTYMSDTSRYSQEEAYVPPRQQWTQGPGRRSPAGMPGPQNVPGGNSSYRGSPVPPTQPGGEYYEDVDPRFADTPAAPSAPTTSTSPLPPVQSTDSYEDIRDIPQGARSPAESDKSNFTSISQRGINPRWNPPPPFPPPSQSGYGMSAIPRRPLPPSTNEVLLNSNPDFELPTARGGPQRTGGQGMIPGSAYPGAPRSPR